MLGKAGIGAMSFLGFFWLASFAFFQCSFPESSLAFWYYGFPVFSILTVFFAVYTLLQLVRATQCWFREN